MKILPINQQYITKLQPFSKSKENHFEVSQITNENRQNYRSLVFQGMSPKYFTAKSYLEGLKETKGEFDKLATDIYELDLNKLNGIQEGIKVFEGLNIKEIAFIARTFLEIATKRGCHNLCSHCYAEAKPPIKESGDAINKMSWEDFSSLTNGFKELNDRLGFYITSPDIPKPNGSFRYLAPFHDADCCDLVIKDKSGMEHDFIDIAEKIYEATGMTPLFDTAGWTPKNTEVQKRIEKIVDYFSKPENKHKINGFNISLNPFHAINTKSVMERRLGHIENSDKLRDIYTTRIANALLTLTPTLKTGKFSPIYRSIAYDTFEGSKGFEYDDLESLYNEIMAKLKSLYKEDLHGEQKYVKTKKQIIKNLHTINKIKKRVPENFTEVGRGVETFGKDNEHYKHATDMRESFQNDVKKYKNTKDFINAPFFGIIDSNGNYYLTTFWNTFPTELKLNFANKNKKTAPIKPLLEEDLVITKNIINSTPENK